jgi:hypothetical protein
MREKLCHEYVKDYNAYAAALRAGFSESMAKTKSGAMVKQMMPYISKLQAKKNDQLVRRGVMTQDEVLQGMSNIGRVNPLDYIRIVSITKGKKTVLATQLKDITELTREQADAITEITEHGGQVTYKLPGVSEKMAARAFIGKHWGITDPKLVNLRITQNITMNAELKDVDTDKLEELESRMIELLGPAARRLLGYRPGDEDQEQAPLEIADGALDSDDDEDDEDR